MNEDALNPDLNQSDQLGDLDVDENVNSETPLFSPGDSKKKSSFGEQLLMSITSGNGQNYAPCWDEYETLEELGEGSYGKIYKVREKNCK
jgi:hypothetical protein